MDLIQIKLPMFNEPSKMIFFLKIEATCKKSETLDGREGYTIKLINM